MPLTAPRSKSGFLGFGIVVLALAAAGCGGSVSGGAGPGTDDGPPDSGPATDSGPNPDCPAPSLVNSAAACNESGLTCPSAFAVTDCSGTRASQCFCDGESWTCEHGGTEACPDASATCPSPDTVVQGGSCNTAPGLVCNGDLELAVPSICGNPTSSCSCANGAWSCTVASAPCYKPPPVCPPSTQVYPGSSCGGFVGDSCVSSNVKITNCSGQTYTTAETCSCDGSTWSCPVAEPPCLPPPPPPPPPVCPDPQYVHAYGGCSYEGLNCAGNPQVCGGQVFYDAFECEGSWIPVATTTCDIYGYPEYDSGYPTPSYDGGAAVDAGTATKVE